MKLFRLGCLFVLFALPVLSPRSFGQGFTVDQQRVYDQLQEARELDDIRGLETIARKNKELCEQIFIKLEGQMSVNDALEAWQVIKDLAGTLDQVNGGNGYGLRAKRVMAMDLEARALRSDLTIQYDGLRGQLVKAMTAQDEQGIQTASNALLDVAENLGKLGEVEYQAYCLSEVAKARQAADQQLEAYKLYDEIDQILKRAGYRNFEFQAQVIAVRDSLKKQGFDPNARPGESTGSVRNTPKSWSQDPAGQRPTDPAPLKYVEDAKLPSKFITPAYSSGGNTALWQDHLLRGNGPAEFKSSFQPLGRKIEVSRKGVKIFIEGEDQERREIKVISKPNLVRMERELEDLEGDGRPPKLKYAWLAATGGTEESRFNLSLNNAPMTDTIFIRFQPACYLKGKFLEQDITILDDNSSGRFGDTLRFPDVTSSLNPEFTFCDAMIVGRGKVAVPFSEYVEVEGAFYHLELSSDDYTLQTRKMDLDTGTVTLAFKGKVKPQSVLIEETREFKGAAFFAVGKKPVTVPVGWYRLSYGIIRKGKKVSQDSCLILPGRTKPFQVKQGENAVLELGAPFSFDFEKQQDSGGDVTIKGRSVVVYGKAGELYTHFFDDPVIPEKVHLRVAGGRSVGKAQAMRRADFEDYRVEGLSVWQPLDLTLPGKSSNSYEVKLELKKHNLLGGPIKSDWK